MNLKDHRDIGKQQNLFHLQDEAAGSVFWHPLGFTLFHTIENYIRRKQQANGYKEVKTPQLIDRKLWEQSGHWQHYSDHMYVANSTDQRLFGIKPMNCPCHVQVFNSGLVSYKQLPMRLAEFGTCHRSEPSGSLHGIMRLRQFTQDDAHIFCTLDQIQSETVNFINLLLSVYKDFGFDNVQIALSTRPANRDSEEHVWDQAEASLANAVKSMGLNAVLQPGEGAFYGPKLEFTLQDNAGRNWQCGTLQLDFVLPKRLNAEYVDNNNNRQQPVMIHRAILGSLERFIGILLEHYSGKLPFWLAPVQATIVPIRSEHDNYAQSVCDELAKAGLRVQVDSRDEMINQRIKESIKQNVPYCIVLGNIEQTNKILNVRALGEKHSQSYTLASFLQMLPQQY